MNVSLYIAKRYLFTKSSNNAINIITAIAGVGVVFAAAALFIVLAGFAGLKYYTLEFTERTDPELKILPKIGKSFLFTNAQQKDLTAIPGVASYTKIIEERVFISVDSKRSLALLKGVDENYKTVIPVDSILTEGQWLASGTSQIVSGYGLANTLSYGTFDYTKSINIFVPKPGAGQVTSVNNAFNAEAVANVGIFDINENQNQNRLFSSLFFAQNLLNYSPNQISAIELKLAPNASRNTVINDLQLFLGADFEIKTREQLNSSLYKMLNTENLAVYLIFTLVLIIALFNVIGSVIMIIIDKKETARTLYNMGLTLKAIRRIFFYQGSLMAILGGVLGLFLGYIIVLLQLQFSLVMITPSLAYPVQISLANTLLVFATITVLGVLASKLASSRITKRLIDAH